MLLMVWRAMGGIAWEWKAAGAALLLCDGGKGAGEERATKMDGKEDGF